MGMKTTRTKVRPPRDTIADALFSATQHKVLQLLFSSPDRSYIGSELIALAGAGTGAVQRELIRLVDSGLVTQRAVGRQKHYQANPDSPIFAELTRHHSQDVGRASGHQRSPAASVRTHRVGSALWINGQGHVEESQRHRSAHCGRRSSPRGTHSALEPAEKALRRKISPTLYSATNSGAGAPQKSVSHAKCSPARA